MKNKAAFQKIFFLLNLILIPYSFVNGQTAYGPVPTEKQLKWQEMEYYGFIHLSVNTYTDMSWGKGDEDPKIFNPVNLDCRQWARICKEAGMEGVIITAKHHSGFCLWPSKYTDYSVKKSPWKNGKGDIMREMADACKEYGLKLGVYLSPWDRNHPDYGKPEYITYFRNQLTELLTNYGEIFEVWFDGANGGDGYYGGANETRKIDRKTYYDWKNTYGLVRKLQPNIVIWNDNGDRADLRWVGTEAGYVGETNWSLLNATGPVTEDMLRHGVENGDSWVPGEVNTSIRPEWFYHLREDSKVKTVPELMQTYYNSVGRNGTLLLNFPIMPNGLIHQNDEKAVVEFAQAQKEAFAVNLAQKVKIEASDFKVNNPKFGASNILDGNKETFWTTNEGTKTASLVLSFDKPTAFNRFLVQEYIQLGQRVKSFTIEAFVKGEWKELAAQTTIGYKRILCFSTVETEKLRFTIKDSKSNPLISNIEIYNAPQILTAPVITRNKSGDVSIVAADSESQVYYTLNGSNPTSKSNKYAEHIKTNDKKLTVKAIAYNAVTGKSSPIIEEKFEISRNTWKILDTTDEDAYKILDGNPNSAWIQNNKKMPVDLIIDLGKTEKLIGFKYLPDQDLRAKGIVTNYKFYVSKDNSKWELVSEGEFSNINNNPLWQNKMFKLINARYVKLQALKNTNDNDRAGYAEIDVITN